MQRGHAEYNSMSGLLQYRLHCGCMVHVKRFRVTPNVSRWIQGPVPDGVPIQPDEVWHLAEGGDLPGKVWFRLASDGRSGWVCTELLIEADRPLTSSTLRSIPLTRIIDRLLTQPMTEDDRGGGLDMTTGVREWYDADRWGLPDAEARAFYMSNAKKPAKARPKERRGGAGPTKDELERFAQAYRWARQYQRHRPVAAAAERMSISRATATRWLKLITEERGESS